MQEKYRHNLLEYYLYQLIYVDESGCDKQAGIRKTGWSPLGITPVKRSKFYQGQRYQIQYYLHILKMASFSPIFTNAQLMPFFLRILSNNLFTIVGDTRVQDEAAVTS